MPNTPLREGGWRKKEVTLREVEASRIIIGPNNAPDEE